MGYKQFGSLSALSPIAKVYESLFAERLEETVFDYKNVYFNSRDYDMFQDKFNLVHYFTLKYTKYSKNLFLNC